MKRLLSEENLTRGRWKIYNFEAIQIIIQKRGSFKLRNSKCLRYVHILWYWIERLLCEQNIDAIWRTAVCTDHRALGMYVIQKHCIKPGWFWCKEENKNNKNENAWKDLYLRWKLLKIFIFEWIEEDSN